MRSGQALAARGSEIFLRDVEALIGFLLRGGGFLLCELRRDAGSFRFFGVGYGSGSRRRSRQVRAGPGRCAAHGSQQGREARQVEGNLRSLQVNVV